MKTLGTLGTLLFCGILAGSMALAAPVSHAKAKAHAHKVARAHKVALRRSKKSVKRNVRVRAARARHAQARKAA